MSATNDPVLSLIGNTPLIEATRLDTGLCRLYLKLESQNPGGSIKDRIALSMIEAAESDGSLKPGGTIVEATAGNTGLGLALVAARKGYRLILVIPDKMSREKILHLKAMGAEVVLTRSDVGKGHPDYYQDKAEQLARATPGAIFIDQFNNPANPLAHETATGPEIWRQMEGKVDAVVVGVGSSGTVTGLSRFFAKSSPATRIVLADPVGSVLHDYLKTGRIGEAGSWLVEGIGEDFIPPIADLSRITASYAVSDKDSFLAARELLRKEGILAGSSSGTLLAAALAYCREQKTPQRVVTLIPDSGNKYLSKMFSDTWLGDHGILETTQRADMGGLISRRQDEGNAVTIGPDDTLLTAYRRMKTYDVSQLPVLQNGQIVGILDESDLLMAIEISSSRFNDPVRMAMTADVETLPASAPIDALQNVFARGHVAVVVEKGEFLGVVTRIDLINHLRRSVGRQEDKS